MTINEKHIHGPVPVEKKEQIVALREYFDGKICILNFYAGEDKPKYIKYQQMESDFEIQTNLGKFQGKRGDYLFTDPSNGKAVVPYKIFKKIF